MELQAAEPPHHPQIIRRDGEYWSIQIDGVSCHLRDAPEISLLGFLLQHPHEEVSALFLERAAGDLSCQPGHRPPLHDARQRACANVTRAIGAVIDQIAIDHPVLAAHLRATVNTGAFCSYHPGPPVRMQWTA
ncbi:MAG: hypothetical protein ABI629_09140 [bacterium]